MLKLLLFCILLVLCWPLAVAALLLFPVVWLSRCLRILGFAVEGVLGLIRGLFLLLRACWAARVNAQRRGGATRTRGTAGGTRRSLCGPSIQT